MKVQALSPWASFQKEAQRDGERKLMLVPQCDSDSKGLQASTDPDVPVLPLSIDLVDVKIIESGYAAIFNNGQHPAFDHLF